MSSAKNSLKILDAITIVRMFAPGFRVIKKSNSWFHKAVGSLFALFGNKEYINTFWTTIGLTTAAPKVFDKEYDPEAWKTILHEGWHAIQFSKKGFWFFVGYLFPQVVAIASIPIQIGLFLLGWWTPWMLLALLFFSPLPAYWRAEWEWEAYRISIACDYWHWGTINPKARDRYCEWIIDNFTGPAYFFMWPFKGAVKKRTLEIIKSLDCGTFVIDDYTQRCKDICVSYRELGY